MLLLLVASLRVWICRSPALLRCVFLMQDGLKDSDVMIRGCQILGRPLGELIIDILTGDYWLHRAIEAALRKSCMHTRMCVNCCWTETLLSCTRAYGLRVLQHVSDVNMAATA